MTELAPLNTHADLQLTSAAPYAPSLHPTVNGYSPPVEDVPEDDSVIRCFCGISEDDGNTVLCEVCNTWQHILCYYPDVNVPDTHVCVDCDPRPYDRKGALERQQNARVLVSPAERKIKKVASKSHKKKVKDGNNILIQTNGWLSGPDGLDRGSGSPREQGPPTKRPKTIHRSSASTSTFAAPGQSRKRAGSTTLNGQSPTKSPRSHSPEGYTGDYFSPEFVRISNAAFQTVSDNSYASISVTNDLRTWLNDTDALMEISPSLTQKDVFTRWDRPIEALKQKSPGVSSCKREDANMIVNGQRPVHRWVEANTACNEGAYIGELNGHIGKLEDYYRDPRNRWDELRHPEPYVFCHDRLPIYVDCREEGSVLRHVGRSCQPNVKLQIIIHGSDFHFCFISLRDIAAGEELTVPWHIRDKELALIRAMNDGSTVRPEDEMNMATWFTNVLANFGGCACSRLGPHVSCHMGRFDLRNKDRPYAQISAKVAKPRKTKRLPTQISPGSTGRATNSRAGSEAVIHGDNDEDMADSRSLSAKSRSQPSSRDITPMMVDTAVGLGVAMSDRERRKLMQQEKLFEKMELDEQTGTRKGKRHSAGSALSTPVPTTSVRSTPLRAFSRTDAKKKQLGFPDSTNPSPTSLNGGSGRPRVNGTTPRPINGTKIVHRPRPEMVSMPTQTDHDPSSPSPSPPRRRTGGSHVSCLLRRVQQESKRRKERSASVMSQEQKPSPTPVAVTKLESTPSPVLSSMPPPPVPTNLSMDPSLPSQPSQPSPPPQAPQEPEQPQPEPFQEPAQPEVNDVDMEDAPQSEPIPPTEAENLENVPEAPTVEEDVPEQIPSETPTQPPAPPWPAEKPPSPVDSLHPTRPTHVTLPPVPSFPMTTPAGQAQSPSTSSTSTEGATPSASTASILTQIPMPLIESPAPISISNPPLLSPSLLSAVQPSPAKKKMSLGDWMKKRKDAQAQQAQKDAEAEGSSAPMSNGSDEIKSDPVEPPASEADADKKADADVALEDMEMSLAAPAAGIATTENGEEENKETDSSDIAHKTESPAVTSSS